MLRKSSSLFDQSIDRSIFVTHFLGAIVPLAGFALVSERLLDSLADPGERLGLLAAIGAIGMLSLGSFLALRRIVFRTIARAEDQNARLESLLEVALELAAAPHPQAVTDASVSWAARLGQADASWLIARSSWDKPFDTLAERGDRAGAWLEAHHDDWSELCVRAAGNDDPIRVDSAAPSQPSVVLLPLTGDLDGEALFVVARSERPFEPTEVDALRTLAAQTSVALTNAERGDSQRNFFSHMTDLVIAALDTHIEYRAGHASRVAACVNRIGRAMGLDDAALHDLHFAALLHDVGMLKIPASHQRDPRHFRRHPAFGARMLARIRVWEKAAPIVSQHHERPDGTGYPDGLVGDDICLGARILAVADAWDAMRCDDVHRDAVPVEDALRELRDHAGTQFDGDVVSTLEGLVREGTI